MALMKKGLSKNIIKENLSQCIQIWFHIKGMLNVDSYLGEKQTPLQRNGMAAIPKIFLHITLYLINFLDFVDSSVFRPALVGC